MQYEDTRATFLSCMYVFPSLHGYPPSLKLGSPVVAVSPEMHKSPDFRKNPYGYIPTEWICILFVVLFSISTGTHGGRPPVRILR